MKIPKFALSLILVLSVCASVRAEEARAPELAPISAADIPSLVPDFKMPAAAMAALRPADDRAPVIITVPGIRFNELGWGPLEFRHFQKLLHFLFPKKELDDAALKEAFDEYNKQFDFLYEGGDFHPEEAALRMPDNGIEKELAKLPEIIASKAAIIPFQWSRDPDDSNNVVPVFVEKLAGVYDTYKGRPIYILAHSWGSVLMHETMHRLEKARPDVRIDKLITIGSPLMPGNAVVKLFMKVQIYAEHLEKAVSKPSNLGYWKNLWAGRDPFSNVIKAADDNFQVDAAVEKLEPTLLDLVLHNASLRKLARQDYVKVIHFGHWHASYIYDYDVSLLSIHKEIDVRVLQPLIAPQIVSKEIR